MSEPQKPISTLDASIHVSNFAGRPVSPFAVARAAKKNGLIVMDHLGRQAIDPADVQKMATTFKATGYLWPHTRIRRREPATA